MALKAVLETLDDVPEHFHELYTKKGEKFELTGIEGVKTQADVDRLTTALTKERADHKTAKDKLAPYVALGDLVEVQTKLESIPELEAKASGNKIDDAKIEAIVEARVKSRVQPVERERDELKTKVTTLEESVSGFQVKDRNRTISDKVREAATKANLLPTALDDALLLGERIFEINEGGDVVTKENAGATPGIMPDVWLSEMQSRRPHWWGDSSGGGSRGSGGGSKFPDNPWSKDHWSMTEQGRVITEKGEKIAEQMAKSAGSHVGATAPTGK